MPTDYKDTQNKLPLVRGYFLRGKAGSSGELETSLGLHRVVDQTWSEKFFLITLGIFFRAGLLFGC